MKNIYNRWKNCLSKPGPPSIPLLHYTCKENLDTVRVIQQHRECGEYFTVTAAHKEKIRLFILCWTVWYLTCYCMQVNTMWSMNICFWWFRKVNAKLIKGKDYSDILSYWLKNQLVNSTPYVPSKVIRVSYQAASMPCMSSLTSIVYWLLLEWSYCCNFCEEGGKNIVLIYYMSVPELEIIKDSLCVWYGMR